MTHSASSCAVSLKRTSVQRAGGQAVVSQAVSSAVVHMCVGASIAVCVTLPLHSVGPTGPFYSGDTARPQPLDELARVMLDVSDVVQVKFKLGERVPLELGPVLQRERGHRLREPRQKQVEESQQLVGRVNALNDDRRARVFP